MKRFLLAVAGAALLLTVHIARAASDTITHKPWGSAPNGASVTLYTLTNTRGMTARITNYGGTLVSLTAPDRHGRMADIALGYDSLGSYVKDVGNTYFGATIGRYANRIARGKYSVDGKRYSAAINNAPNSLHGGTSGFNKKVWGATTRETASGPSLILTRISPDGEEGYPGALTVKVVYTLLNSDALQIDYSARTTKDTVLNLTNHAYWNLNGAGHGTILNHVMMINANEFTPIDKTSIPLGPLGSVVGTPFDFRHPMPIGARINEKNTQLANGAGYDHNFVVNGTPGKLRVAARVYSPLSGRVLTVLTTEPGIQFYTGNFLSGLQIGTGGLPYARRTGFALEAQHFPDSPNKPSYPTTELKPGRTYHQTTVYAFSTR